MDKGHYKVSIRSEGELVFNTDAPVPGTGEKVIVEVEPGSLPGVEKPFSIIIEKVEPETPELDALTADRGGQLSTG